MGFSDAARSADNARQPETARQRLISVRLYQQWPELQRLCLDEPDQLGRHRRSHAKRPRAAVIIPAEIAAGAGGDKGVGGWIETDSGGETGVRQENGKKGEGGQKITSDRCLHCDIFQKI